MGVSYTYGFWLLDAPVWRQELDLTILMIPFQPIIFYNSSLVKSIVDRWTVGLDDLRGLYQPWWFYDSILILHQFALSKLLQTGSAKHCWYSQVACQGMAQVTQPCVFPFLILDVELRQYVSCSRAWKLVMGMELPHILQVPLHLDSIPFPSNVGCRLESEERWWTTQVLDWPVKWGSTHGYTSVHGNTQKNSLSLGKESFTKHPGKCHMEKTLCNVRA